VRTSKFTAFMALKVVVCIGSDSVENVLGVGGAPVMLMSAPMVVYGQWWHDVGSGENEMLKGHAVESERRWSNGSTAIGVLG
jgi:hypothetical protein